MADDQSIQGDNTISGDGNIIARLLIGGNFEGNIHIGNTIYNSSEIEILRDYLSRTIPACEVELYRALLRPIPANQPYKYLYSFEIEDAALFFGRDAAIQELHQHLKQDRLTVLHAPSGTGKTSLLKAGLAPLLLREGYLPVYVRVSQDPILATKQALAPPIQAPWPAMLADLSLYGFLGVVCGLISPQTKGIVLILDQLEELFSSTVEETFRQQWLEALYACYQDKNLPIHFLLGIRDDYLANLAEFETRFPNIFHNRMRLQPLSRDEAIRAVCDPLARMTPPRHYARGLPELIINDLGEKKIETPQLQIVCSKIYESLAVHDLEISVEKYQTLGGAETILGDYLRGEVEKMGGNAALARAILIELVSLENTRLQRTEKEIGESLSQRPDLNNLIPILTALVNARLLQTIEAEGQIRFELTHDYLLGQIRKWVTIEDVRSRQMRDILEHALSAWTMQGWLLDVNAFRYVDMHRELITKLSTAEAVLLLRSAVATEVSVDFWALIALQKGIDIWPILQPALSAPDHRLRARLAHVLPGLGKMALHGLQPLLSDEFPDVRAQAIQAWYASSGQVPHPLRYEAYISPDQDHPGFMMDKYPITCRDYERFLVENPNTNPPPNWNVSTADLDKLDHPVVSISWNEAQAYAQWAGKRLPTASEWRRAAGQNRYPWGNEENSVFCNSRETALGGTTPVGMFSPQSDSSFGVSDMAGNVWEWLSDEHQQKHLLLGGSWFYSIEFARVDAYGLWRSSDTRSNFIGLRLCFDLK
jgi:hypothetical protein